MKTVDDVKKSVAELKAKLAASAKEGAKPAEARALRKRVKRAQRHLRQMSGRKLAAIRKKHGGEESAPAPAAPPAGGEAKK